MASSSKLQRLFELEAQTDRQAAEIAVLQQRFHSATERAAKEQAAREAIERLLRVHETKAQSGVEQQDEMRRLSERAANSEARAAGAEEQARRFSGEAEQHQLKAVEAQGQVQSMRQARDAAQAELLALRDSGALQERALQRQCAELAQRLQSAESRVPVGVQERTTKLARELRSLQASKATLLEDMKQLRSCATTLPSQVLAALQQQGQQQREGAQSLHRLSTERDRALAMLNASISDARDACVASHRRGAAVGALRSLMRTHTLQNATRLFWRWRCPQAPRGALQPLMHAAVHSWARAAAARALSLWKTLVMLKMREAAAGQTREIELAEMFCEAEGARERAQKKLAAVQGQLKAAERREAALGTELQRQQGAARVAAGKEEEKLSVLSSELAALKGELLGSQAALASMQAQHAPAIAQAAALLDQLAPQPPSQVPALQAELARLGQQLGALEGSPGGRASDAAMIEDLRTELSAERLRSTALEGELEQMSEHINTFMHECRGRSVSSSVSPSVPRAEILSEEVAELEEQLKTAAEEREQLLTQGHQDREGMHRAMAALESTVAAKQAELAGCQAELVLAKRRAQSLQGSLQELSRRCASLEAGGVPVGLARAVALKLALPHRAARVVHLWQARVRRAAPRLQRALGRLARAQHTHRLRARCFSALARHARSKPGVHRALLLLGLVLRARRVARVVQSWRGGASEHRSGQLQAKLSAYEQRLAGVRQIREQASRLEEAAQIA